MAVTHVQAALQAATDAVVDLIDVGAGSNGTLEILDDTTVLTSHALAATAFGAAAASGVATAAAIGDATAGNTGTADKWKVKDADGDELFAGAAGIKRSITAVGTGAGGSFGVAGDHTAEFAAGTEFTVTGSTGNDGTYTVASVSESGGTTTIVVEADQTVSNATVDGSVHVGQLGLDNTSITSGQSVSVSAFTYKALRS